MNHLELNGTTIKESFDIFNKNNPHIYELFEMKAMTAVKLGKRKISSKLILNVIRWENFIDTDDKLSRYKLNDSYSSHYARLFAEKNPKYSTVFNYRALRSTQPKKNKYGIFSKLNITFNK